MLLQLQNVDLYGGIRAARNEDPKPQGEFQAGSYVIRKVEPSVLTEKCNLNVHIERNLSSDASHCGMCRNYFSAVVKRFCYFSARQQCQCGIIHTRYIVEFETVSFGTRPFNLQLRRKY